MNTADGADSADEMPAFNFVDDSMGETVVQNVDTGNVLGEAMDTSDVTKHAKDGNAANAIAATDSTQKTDSVGGTGSGLVLSSHLNQLPWPAENLEKGLVAHAKPKADHSALVVAACMLGLRYVTMSY